MPVATVSETVTTPSVQDLKSSLGRLNLRPEADLRQFEHIDNSPSIGTEFRSYSKKGKPVLTIREVLADEGKLAALGRLVSERGVVFFRDSEITPEEQKVLVQKLGEAGGKPADSTLHIHPLTLAGSELGDEISVISNKFVFDDKFKRLDDAHYNRVGGKRLWHSDITFENKPSDYASLVIRDLPAVGGDTLWASAYEAYDRLSPAYKKFLEGLTATHIGSHFLELAKRSGAEVREPRGSPDNVGQHLSTVHPVIRTNPVTGWNGLFVNQGFTKRINELTQTESDEVLKFLWDHIASNHEFQVRFRWEENSLAIWDNRSTFHAATHDVDEVTRTGTRSVSIGERPYFDPKSISRKEYFTRPTEKA
ncbi:putative taurine dioxygenase [Papiliotrema laurentii]|uniref:Taurine dioxygenase n=1 Tax=Papiliotrema laurentii TaxID=5418 RepID=A0AAD9FVK4_PAPLA|nr:putative taurine dioxygenase [Papiliotrema laurentii]